MIWLAIVLQALFLGLAFVLRTALHIRRTGATGFRALSQTRDAAERAGVLLFTVAGAAGVIGVIVDVFSSNLTFGPMDRPAIAVPGVVIAIAGLCLVMLAQSDMGSSWRIGVDTSEKTDLVTGGLFRHVRNPIFLGMLAFWAGAGLITPNVFSLAAPLLGLAGAEVQVRLVEEPYLLRTHGPAYRRYAATAGRFVPWIGRLRDTQSSASPSSPQR